LAYFFINTRQITYAILSGARSASAYHTIQVTSIEKRVFFLPYTDKMFVNDYIDRLAEVMTHIEAIRNTST
jgi:hypothetical protein